MSRVDELFAAAKEARLTAHAPYSRFLVGAAILTPAGNIYSGSNVENASYPEGCCAETSAISHMIRAGEKEISEILVVGDAANCSPCGGCRQRISEFGTDETVIHIADLEKVHTGMTLPELIPGRFRLLAE